MTILDVAIAIQLHVGAKRASEIGAKESWRLFLRLCAFAPVLAAIVGLLDFAGMEGRTIVATLRAP